MSHLKVAKLFKNIKLIEPSVFLFLPPDVFSNALFISTCRRHKVPSCPKVLHCKVMLVPTICPCNVNCNPTTCGLNFVSHPSKTSLTVNFEQFTVRRLSYIPGNVKLWESPGRAGGLPTIIGSFSLQVGN